MELITRNQYMKRYNIGYDKMQRMIANKEVDYLKEADRIRIDDKTVRIELYEEEKSKRIKAETTIHLLQNILLGKEINQWKEKH